MRRDELIIGEKIFDSIYALRTKREEIYDVDKLTNIGETTQDRLIESIRKDHRSGRGILLFSGL